MSRLIAVSAAATLLGLTACSITVPVVVIATGGQTLRGSATAAIGGGTFEVTDGDLTCSGNYNSWSMEFTITMQTVCSDGRRGFIIATRDSTGMNGQGRLRLNDGTTGDFIFGAAAANY